MKSRKQHTTNKNQTPIYLVKIKTRPRTNSSKDSPWTGSPWTGNSSTCSRTETRPRTVLGRVFSI